MFSLLAIAVVESVSHALENKEWHEAAYLRKHTQIYKVAHCEYHLISFFADQLV